MRARVVTFALLIDNGDHRVLNFVDFDGNNISVLAPQIIDANPVASPDELLLCLGFGRSREWHPANRSGSAQICAVRPVRGGVLS